MPIRIYALAKELNIDSKELVEVCNKAGISGKGSALASLDTDEVDKVRAYLSGPKTTAAEAPAATEMAPERPQRGDFSPGGSRIRVIPKTSRPPRPEPQPSEPEAAPAAEAPAAEAPSAEPPAAPPEQEPAAPAAGSGSDLQAPIRPEPPPLPERKKPPKPTKPKRAREPVIKLPDLPQVQQPSAETAKPAEPKVQKPTIRLTSEAFTNKKRPPLEQLAAKAERGKKGPLTPEEAAMAPLSTKGGRRGKGKSGAPDDEDRRSLAAMSGGRTSRQQVRKRKKVRDDRDDDGSRMRTLRRTGRNTALPRKGNVVLELPCTIRSFSEAAGISAGELLKTMMLKLNMQANINAQLEEETAQLLAAEMGVELEFRHPETAEDQLLASFEEPDEESQLQPRPPIVTFLGHVDHGKTSLLDYLIGTNVVSGEAGGITQHIRAYKVSTKDGREVAFVDTPGHEAFTEMRARGANVTDIVVLVIAADDGIMPQTEEAISHAKAAEVPMVVAMNKMDLPGADPNKVLTQMTEHELTPSEWGGDIEVVRTSAVTGQGMDDLLETLLTIAELHEYRANPDRNANGTCLEAEQEPGRGVIAKVVVRKGTLHVGDNIVCGASFGRIKAIFDTLSNTRLESAGPSTPVNVTGFDNPPAAGETFYVVDDIADARDIAENREVQSRDTRLSGRSVEVTFEQFQQMLEDGRLGQTGEVATLNLIIRADVRGSVEAIVKELDKFAHPEVQIRKLQTSVGGITVGDVHLAHASQAVIVGFNVIPDEAARALADDLGVQIRRYDVIYKLTDDIKAMVEGKLRPEERVIELGRAVVKEVFNISRVGVVAGCYVIQGSIQRGCRIRVNRDGRTIGDYPLDSLRRIKEDVKEVPRGMECGIKLSGFNDVKKDDLLEAYKIEEVARTL